MLKIEIKNVEKELKKVEKEIKKTVHKKVKLNAKNLLQDLKISTPIDEGRARDGWYLTDFTNVIINKLDASVEINNDVPYITELNDGSSRQAPARFIELNALRYGIPVGSVVTKK